MNKEMYYVSVYVTSTKNKKETEMYDWLRENANHTLLIGGKEAFLRYFAQIVSKVNELNMKYPRSKELNTGLWWEDLLKGGSVGDFASIHVTPIEHEFSV